MWILGLRGLTENIRAFFPQGQAKLFTTYIEVCVLSGCLKSEFQLYSPAVWRISDCTRLWLKWRCCYGNPGFVGSLIWNDIQPTVTFKVFSSIHQEDYKKILSAVHLRRMSSSYRQFIYREIWKIQSRPAWCIQQGNFSVFIKTPIM